MSKARERREKRRQRRDVISKGTQTLRQIETPDNVRIPKVQMPRNRWLFLIPLAVIVLFGVISALGSVNPLDAVSLPNAIWLDATWSYDDPSDEEITELVNTLRTNQIGILYVYISSLGSDNIWAGDVTTNRDQFSDVAPGVESFISRLDAAYPDATIYGWIEFLTNPPQGYRMDNPEVHQIIADFSLQTLEDFALDGVMLDVKPVFEDSTDYLTLLRAVRQALGLDQRIAVTAPADLTPRGTLLNLPEVIAPGTEWSEDFKESVGLLVDQIVVTAYNSYHTNPVDYIEWVRYQVEAYSRAIDTITDEGFLLIGIPNYDDMLPAHDRDIESLAGALDGTLRGINSLNEARQAVIQGVAIFTDDPLTADEWRIYQEKWLDR